MRRLLAALLLVAAPAFGQSVETKRVSAETKRVDGSSTSGATGTTYNSTTDTVTGTGTITARNMTASGLATPGAITVTPVLSKIGAITVVAGSALADGDGLVVGDGTGTVPIEFDASPGDGTTGGAVPIIFDGTETATEIRDAVKAILDGAGRDWTTSAQGADGIGLVRATPGATGGGIAEDVTDAGFLVTDWTDPTHATTVTYQLVACLADGTCTQAGPDSTTAVSTATLSASNFLRLSWSAVTGASSYKVYRKVAPTTPATVGIVYSGTALTVDDTGLVGDTTTASLRNLTGVLTGKTPGSAATWRVCASNAVNTAACDYVCDGTADEVQIQAAVDALPATGGVISLSEGAYSLTAAILTRFGTSIIGAGIDATTLTAAAGTWSPNRGLIVAKNDAGVKGATAGNMISVSDMTLNVGGIASVSGIYSWGYLGNTSNLRVQRVRITNSGNSGYGIFGSYASDATVTDSTFDNLGDSAIETRNSSRWMMSSNVFSGASALQVYASAVATDHVFTGNLCYNSSVFGTYVAGVSSRGLTITGNTFVRAAGSSSGFVIIKALDGVTISGNVFNGATDTAAYNLPLLTFSSTAPAPTHAVVTGNVFLLGTASSGTVSYPAIKVSGSNGLLIEGNMISSPGTTTSTGILVDNAAAADLVIRNNRIVGAGAGASRVGISIAAATGVHVEGNFYNTLETGVDIVAGATSTRIVGPLWTTDVDVPIADAGTTTSYQGVSVLLPTYADNAAAITGGLAAGDPYRTSTGVLMVTYTP